MYDHTQIEEKWHALWDREQLFQGSEQLIPGKEKIYLLFAFAYPSGSGLHVGHVESKTALDILARFHRMNGKQVFFPVGWDAFGLPAENYAIKTGVHPAQTTKQAITTFRKQIQRVGISYDWKNELATNHPEYYKWTQWIFTELYKKGLAYQKNGMVNWCPSCQTVLANEQVVNGLCERCDTQIIQKEMKQWYYQITKYQDELISGLDQVDWPTPTKTQQLHWIGKKQGTIVTFPLEGQDSAIECFTTRVDTIFGVSFIVISPEKFLELNLLDTLDLEKQEEVREYIDASFRKTEEDRQKGLKNKTGVDTGLHAINPVNQAIIPIFVADYVLGGFGSGAVMGVPAHDLRDADFAKKYNLPSIQVIDNQPMEEIDILGTLVNSGVYTGLSSAEALAAITADYSSNIRQTTHYRLRDWLISRQRYWGTPIPIIYDPDGEPHLVELGNLPWTLPVDVDFKPTGESPLKSSVEFIARTQRHAAEHFADLIKEKGWSADGSGWEPEFDTMDTFVDSSWYFLRYVSARNSDVFAEKSQLEQWLPVDLYMIGPEHIVLHLLYSRFFTKFLRDCGHLHFDEPFTKMRHQGMILGPDGKKMSKSKGNVINPDEIIAKFGADTLRVYEMFMGPLDADKPWDVRAVIGIYKFLQKIHKLVIQVELPEATGKELQRLEQKLHQTIQRVTQDIPQLKFNTAIAGLMEFANLWQEVVLQQKQTIGTDQKRIISKLLAPFAPFLAEELYAFCEGSLDKAGAEKEYSGVHCADWPVFDPAKTATEQAVLPIQINGKLRAQLVVSVSQLEHADDLTAQALALPELAKYLDGQVVKKTIYIQGKVISIVI